jgi:hypothetical protein
MAGHSLTFRFRGICTHFRYGVAAGVPHRVVLPDATQVMAGVVTVQNVTPEPVFYYLTPHFPQLELESGSTALTIPGLIHNGDIVSGVRLQVINAVDREMSYLDDRVPRLTEFVPDYNFASEVVLGGRAMCYVDLYGGTVWSEQPADPERPLQLFIKVSTEGPPELLVSPLLSPGKPAISYRLPLAREGEPPDVTLFVKNLEAVLERPSEEQSGEFDYLLHFLTARGGIPETVVRPTPGMPKTPRSATKERFAHALHQLGDLLLPPPAGAPSKRTLLGDLDVTPSCSDSGYP